MSEIEPSIRHRIAQRAAAELETRLAEPLAGGLYFVSTPIGNLGDVTLRALSIMALAGRLYCEDTRHSLKLLTRFGIERRLDAYHEHNAERERPRILAALAAGASVAIISDAGTPLISDPGFKLVRAAIEAGYDVHAVPGASAVLAGLVGAGLPTDSFHFAGFLPPRSGPRQARITALAKATGTLILFEAPGRLAECLDDLAAILGDRPAAVGRELTKLNETFHRGNLASLAAWARTGELKGECVVLIGPGDEPVASDEVVRVALQEALQSRSMRDAVSEIATRLGVPRRRVYDLALAMKNEQRPGMADDGER